MSLDLGEGGTVTGQLVRLVLLITILSLAPSILVMVTSFTRVVVVPAFPLSALGLQQTPPNAVLISLALLVTRSSWRQRSSGLDPTIRRTRGSSPRVTERESPR